MCRSARSRTAAGPDSSRRGFTLVEIIAVLVLLALLGLAGAEALRAVLTGYSLAKSSDEVVQKAQMALARMTIEFSYLDPTDTASNSGSATSLAYVAQLPTGNETHAIALSGNQLLYTAGGAQYVLADNVATGGLTFAYYDSYNDASPATSLSAFTRLIAITLTMHGKNWPTGLNKTFTTRVFCNKLSN